MTISVRDASVWKPAAPYVKDGGLWKPVQQGFVRDAGVWKEFYSAFVPIAFLDATYSSGASGTTPAYAAGDFIIIAAGRRDSLSYAGAPGISGVNLINGAVFSSGTTANQRNVAIFAGIAASSAPSGTAFTCANAYHLTAMVFEGVAAIGNFSSRNASSGNTNSPTFNAVTITAPTSWVVGSYFAANMQSDPAGMVRTTGNMAVRTTGPVSSFSSRSSSIMTSSADISATFELLQA